MDDRLPVTRRTLQRDLVLNAASKPVAVAVGAVVAAVALLLGTTWLLGVAVVAYVALALATLFDEDEAARVGRRAYERAGALRPSARPLPPGLAPELTELVERARAEEQRVLDALRRSDVPATLVAAEVNALVAEMERVACRAQLLWAYREGQPVELRRRLALLRDGAGTSGAVGARSRAAAALEDRIRLAEALDGEYERFVAEMEHLIASLGVVHAQLVRMSVADDVRVREDVAHEVRALRERVGTVADSMRDAVATFDDDA